jgi:hypothetical protein
MPANQVSLAAYRLALEDEEVFKAELADQKEQGEGISVGLSPQAQRIQRAVQ